MEEWTQFISRVADHQILIRYYKSETPKWTQKSQVRQIMDMCLYKTLKKLFYNYELFRPFEFQNFPKNKTIPILGMSKFSYLEIVLFLVKFHQTIYNTGDFKWNSIGLPVFFFDWTNFKHMPKWRSVFPWCHRVYIAFTQVLENASHCCVFSLILSEHSLFLSELSFYATDHNKTSRSHKRENYRCIYRIYYL